MPNVVNLIVALKAIVVAALATLIAIAVIVFKFESDKLEYTQC